MTTSEPWPGLSCVPEHLQGKPWPGSGPCLAPVQPCSLTTSQLCCSACWDIIAAWGSGWARSGTEVAVTSGRDHKALASSRCVGCWREVR